MVTTKLSDHGVFHSAFSQALPHRKIDSQKDRPPQTLLSTTFGFNFTSL